MNWLKQNWIKIVKKDIIQRLKKVLLLIFSNTNRETIASGVFLLGLVAFSSFEASEFIPVFDWFFLAVLTIFSVQIIRDLRQQLSKLSPTFFNQKNFFIFLGFFLADIVILYLVLFYTSDEIVYQTHIFSILLEIIAGFSLALLLAAVAPLAYLTLHMGMNPLRRSQPPAEFSVRKPFLSLSTLRTNKLLTGLVVLAGVFIALSVYEIKTNPLLSLKCPDDYSSSEEKLADFDIWVSNFYDKNPGATYDDLSTARKRFYINHDCKEALNRLVDWESDNVEPETKAKVYEAIDEVFNVARSKEELCQVGSFTAPLAEELDFYQEVSRDDFVKYLRVALDNFLSGKYGSATHPRTSYKCLHTGLIEGVQCPDGTFDEEGEFKYGLSKIDRTYLASKFIVLGTDVAVTGGESIVLLFKDRPDKVFNAWVYRYRGEGDIIRGFDLRAFDEFDLTKHNAPDINETQEIFINQICSPELGI